MGSAADSNLPSFSDRLPALSHWRFSPSLLPPSNLTSLGSQTIIFAFLWAGSSLDVFLITFSPLLLWFDAIWPKAISSRQGAFTAVKMSGTGEPGLPEPPLVDWGENGGLFACSCR
jgi:hypothetical protein